MLNNSSYIRTRTVLFLFALACSATTLSAQTVADHLKSGDRARDARNSALALTEYRAAIRLDSANVRALRNAAVALVALAEFGDDKDVRKGMADTAEIYATRAFKLDSTSAEAHFVLAQALGRVAELNLMAGLKNGILVHEHAAACLVMEPKHAGCAHVIGAWHAELMRRSGAIRSIAASMSKNPIYTTANWDSAQVYLERAVANAPNRIIHRLALGRVYVDRDKKDKARVEFAAVQRMALVDYSDEEYKKQAAAELAKLE